jgi:hypothetical protein
LPIALHSIAAKYSHVRNVLSFLHLSQAIINSFHSIPIRIRTPHPYLPSPNPLCDTKKRHAFYKAHLIESLAALFLSVTRLCINRCGRISFESRSRRVEMKPDSVNREQKM